MPVSGEPKGTDSLSGDTPRSPPPSLNVIQNSDKSGMDIDNMMEFTEKDLKNTTYESQEEKDEANAVARGEANSQGNNARQEDAEQVDQRESSSVTDTDLNGVNYDQKIGSSQPSDEDQAAAALLMDMPLPTREDSIATADPSQTKHEIEWIKKEENGNLLYTGFKNDSIVVKIGSFVYLKSADAGMPPFIGKVKSFENAQSPTIQEDADDLVVLEWYYRAEELKIDFPISVFQNEIFASDEIAKLSPHTVCGTCSVYPPKAGAGRVKQDEFVCSRKYIPQEGRIMPLEGVDDNGSNREYLLSDGTVKLKGPPAPTSRSLKGQREISRATKKSSRKRKPKAQSPESDPEPPLRVTKGGRVIHPPKHMSTWTPPDAPAEEEQEQSQRPKSKYGRWTAERYETAQSSLVSILKNLGASHPHKAILRPSLREEARKMIGDTGLLDHLLKHLADQIVTPNGEKLRRRHNREGHMEYWIQDPMMADEEEAMLKQEMYALSDELRQIHEARNLLKQVRDEADIAIKTVASGSKPKTVAALGTDDTLRNVGLIVDGLTADLGNVGQRLSNLEADLKTLHESVSRFRIENMGQIFQITNKFNERLEAQDDLIATLRKEVMKLTSEN